MDDAERQRTMDFILRQQAQFASGMQRLEGQQSRFAEQQAQSSEHQRRADDRIDQLRRVLLMTVRQFRRERRDLRERMAALLDAQIKTEEITRQNSEAIRALTKGADEQKRGGGNGEMPG